MCYIPAGIMPPSVFFVRAALTPLRESARAAVATVSRRSRAFSRQVRRHVHSVTVPRSPAASEQWYLPPFIKICCETL